MASESIHYYLALPVGFVCGQALVVAVEADVGFLELLGALQFVIAEGLLFVYGVEFAGTD